MRRPFLEALAKGPLVFDGAMGTQLYERGIYINRSFDDANLSSQALVRQIHEDYVAAGANVLTTNTFAANRIKLRRHGLEARLLEINQAGVQLAREAAGDDVYVAGSIGPTGLVPPMLSDRELDEISAAFAERLDRHREPQVCPANFAGRLADFRNRNGRGHRCEQRESAFAHFWQL